MQPRAYTFLDELENVNKQKAHYQRYVKYSEELTAFDKKRALKRVKYPGWISWWVRWDDGWRDPHPSQLPRWAFLQYVTDKNDN